MPKITINFSEPFLLGSPAHRSEVTSYLDYPSPELYNDVQPHISYYDNPGEVLVWLSSSTSFHPHYSWATCGPFEVQTA